MGQIFGGQAVIYIGPNSVAAISYTSSHAPVLSGLGLLIKTDLKRADETPFFWPPISDFIIPAPTNTPEESYPYDPIRFKGILILLATLKSCYG